MFVKISHLNSHFPAFIHAGKRVCSGSRVVCSDFQLLADVVNNVKKQSVLIKSVTIMN